MWPAFQHQSTTSKASPRAQHGAKKATRRDFVLANDLAVLAIISCSVDTKACFDVHSPVVIQLCRRDFSPTVFVARKPWSFDWQRIQQTCIQRIDEEKQSSSNIDGATKHGSLTNEEIKICEQHRLENSFQKLFSKVKSQLEEALARRDPSRWPRRTGLLMCVSIARQRGNSSLDTEKRGIHSEDTKPHRFSKTTTDTPLFPPKPLKRTSSRNRYTRFCNTSGDPAKPTQTDGRLSIRNTWERATQNEKWNAHTNMTIQTPTSWVALMKNLQRAIRNIDRHVKQLFHSEYKEHRKRFAAKLADDPAGGREFRAIREYQSDPSSFLWMTTEPYTPTR